jgi:hypothetical protein
MASGDGGDCRHREPPARSRTEIPMTLFAILLVGAPLVLPVPGAPAAQADEDVRLIVKLYDKRGGVHQVELKCTKDELFDLNEIVDVNGKKINFADKAAKIELVKGPAWKEGDRIILLDHIKKDGPKVTVQDLGQLNLNTLKDNLPGGSWADRVAGIHFKPAAGK